MDKLRIEESVNSLAKRLLALYNRQAAEADRLLVGRLISAASEVDKNIAAADVLNYGTLGDQEED